MIFCELRTVSSNIHQSLRISIAPTLRNTTKIHKRFQSLVRTIASSKANIIMGKKVLVPLAPGSEELEAVGIINVLRRGNIDVHVASITDSLTVECARKTKIVCDTLLKDIKPSVHFDMIVLPGGMPGATNMSQCHLLIDMIKEQKKQGRWYAAICASPAVVLKKHDLLPKHATCYPSFQDEMKGALDIKERVVIDEESKVVTSQGPGTVLQFALEVLRLLTDKPTADKVKEGMLVQ
mmetsp:Transcript_19685/g.33745  ORF Transcript_19685/g.33745 Transcript_19685/m.33745 type:complete len:237 (+) Transcript_19685:39-749(+)